MQQHRRKELQFVSSLLAIARTSAQSTSRISVQLPRQSTTSFELLSAATAKSMRSDSVP